MKLKQNLFELNVLNEIKCYILITLMYIPNTCRLVWNKNYMLSEISVKVFRSGRKLVGSAETDILYCSHNFFSKTLLVNISA
jgi:hypothetical protein